MVYKIVLSIAVLLGGFGVISVATNSNPDCINLYVDYGVLGEPTVEECIQWVDEVKALDFLKNNGFKVQGTAKYGDAVVCRLNNLPGIKEESCEEMPSEKAYWAILEKRKQLIPNPFDLNGKYTWAQVGINELSIKPGDSLALVFADNGNVRFP